MELPQLYLITDRHQVPEGNLYKTLLAAMEGGARLLQLREKDLPESKLTGLIQKIKLMAKQYDARIILNGSAPLSLAALCDGVQLGAATITISEARRVLGSKALIGYSTHSVEEARIAASEGADFITFGPVFDTPSKRLYGKPVGLSKLSEAVRAVRIPVYGLGGIKISNTQNVIESGCHGIAMISEIIASTSPEETTRKILSQLDATIS